MMRSSLASALVQLERDLKMVRRRLAGDRPSPVLYARPIASAVAMRGPRDRRELVVTRVVRETHDVVTLVLEPADVSSPAFVFQPGQFFTVLADVEGEIVPRNYSASNVPGTRELHLTIKERPGGRVSGRLSAVRPGQRVHVLGPFGTFTVGPSQVTRRRLVLVAGGVGITPLLSIARSVLAADAAAQIALVYGNRREEDIAFATELERLASKHAGRLQVRHVLEDPRPGFAGDRGRLDRATTARILGELALEEGTELFVCGPRGMQDEVLAAAASLGIAEDRIKRERFAIGSARSSIGSRGCTPEHARAAHDITIVSRDGLVRTTAIAGSSLLEAGLAASVAMPFSCGVGGCGACRVRLVEGEVDLEEPHCLSDDERSAGYVLACIGRPRRACTIEIERDERRGGRT